MCIGEVKSGKDLESITGRSTHRQMDVLTLITHGWANKQIAREIILSENTVKVHVSAKRRALGLSNRTQTGILGQKLGLSKSQDIKKQ